MTGEGETLVGGAENGTGQRDVTRFPVRADEFAWVARRRSASATPEAGETAKILLQGTLDLMVLKRLDSMGPQHGYGIARRIEQISDDVLTLNEGTVYASLMRLQHQGWISASWGTSENNRRARFYAITRLGRRQLARETETWERIAGVIHRLLRAEPS